MSDGGQFHFELEQLDGYAFNVQFDWPAADSLLLDEPAPLGEQSGPNAARLVAAAAANCLSASLMFCLFKDAPPDGVVRAEVTGTIDRNEVGRLRLTRLDVRLLVDDQVLESKRLDRCLNLFEDFCVVTASLRQGINVRVDVATESGQVLKPSPA